MEREPYSYLEKSSMIGFIRSGVHPDFVLSFKHTLNNMQIEVFAICEDINEKKQYDESILVFCLEEWLETNWNLINIEDLEIYQERYNTYSLWEIYHTDRYIRYKYKYHDAIRVLIGMISFWEYIYTSTKASYIISDSIIGANTFFAMIVGKKFNAEFISIVDGRGKKYFSYLSTGEGYVDNKLSVLLHENKEIEKNDLEYTKQYIDEYIGNRKQPAYMSDLGNANKQLGATLLFYLKRLKNISYLWDKKFNNKYNIHLYRERISSLSTLMEAIRKPQISKYFADPDYNEKYVLVPLHFQPEASTCVFARKYENQLFFIEQLSKSIPADKILYVKEHSVRQGHRPLSFYKQLEKYPNVKLIAPDINNHILIQNSSYIVCLTSTMGYEALMYGKPVFVCGDCFFENFPGVIKIHDVFDEKEKFFNPPQQDRDEYLRFMTYYLRSLRFCTVLESTVFNETEEEISIIQKETIKWILDFIKELTQNENS